MTMTKIVNKLNQRVRTDRAQNASQSVDSCGALQTAGNRGDFAEFSRKTAEGQEMLVFYCLNCTQSFRAQGREDPECLEKWHYHAWLAKCPRCGAEARQTDIYWR